MDQYFTVKQVITGLCEENTYLVYRSDRTDALLIDPGDDYDAIDALLCASGRQLSDILLTHGHFDHMICAPRLREKTGAPIHIHALEHAMLQDAALNLYSPATCREAFSPYTAEDEMRFAESHDLTICGMNIRAMFTPGHTPGGVCYYFPAQSTLFSGDTLFAGGAVGRTDFPGGDADKLHRSVETLLTLPQSTTLYAGHGPQTRMAQILGDWI